MKISSGKENILKKIRQALSESTPIPFPQSEGNHSVFLPSRQELEVEFAEQFTRLLGQISSLCIDHSELVTQLKALAGHQNWKKIVCREERLQALLRKEAFDAFTDTGLAECDAAITSCETLIARTGSIVMSTGGGNASGRTVSVYAPRAYLHRLVGSTGLRYQRWTGRPKGKISAAAPFPVHFRHRSQSNRRYREDIGCRRAWTQGSVSCSLR